MNKIVLSLTILGIASTSWAYEPWQYKKPYKDTWGNSYRYQQNLYKDTDRDGTLNMFDYDDANPRIQQPNQYDWKTRTFSAPQYRFAPATYRPNYLLNDEE